MGFLDSITDSWVYKFLNGPGLPPLTACGKTKEEEIQERIPDLLKKLSGFFQYSETDMTNVLGDKICQLRGIDDVESFAWNLADYTVRRKLSTHQKAPQAGKVEARKAEPGKIETSEVEASEVEARNIIANLREDRKYLLINAWGARIAGKINAKLKEKEVELNRPLSSAEKTAAMLEMFFPIPGMRETFTKWCPAANTNPYKTCEAQVVPLPEPIVVPGATPGDLVLTLRGDRTGLIRGRYDENGNGTRRTNEFGNFQTQTPYPGGRTFQAPQYPGGTFQTPVQYPGGAGTNQSQFRGM